MNRLRKTLLSATATALALSNGPVFAQQCAQDLSQIRGDVPLLSAQGGAAFSMPISQMVQQAGGAEFGIALLQAQIDELQRVRDVAAQGARQSSATNTIATPAECPAGADSLNCLTSQAYWVATEGILVNQFLLEAFTCQLGVSLRQSAPSDSRIVEELASLQQATASAEQEYQRLLAERTATRQREEAEASRRRRQQWEAAATTILAIGVGVLGGLAGVRMAPPTSSASRAPASTFRCPRASYYDPRNTSTCEP